MINKALLATNVAFKPRWSEFMLHYFVVNIVYDVLFALRAFNLEIIR